MLVLVDITYDCILFSLMFAVLVEDESKYVKQEWQWLYSYSQTIQAAENLYNKQPLPPHITHGLNSVCTCSTTTTQLLLYTAITGENTVIYTQVLSAFFVVYSVLCS